MNKDIIFDNLYSLTHMLHLTLLSATLGHLLGCCTGML